MHRIRSHLVLALLVGCQGTSAKDRPPEAPVAGIQVRAANGDVIARVVAGRPCRATIEGQDLQIGGRPLVTMVGAARWTGRDDKNGTTLERDGTAVARIFPTEILPTEVALFDHQGVALVRVKVTGDRAALVGGAGQLLRTAIKTPTGITVGDLTVTGTDDLLLAAVLSAPEALPEVRGLAACHRLLPTETAF